MTEQPIDPLSIKFFYLKADLLKTKDQAMKAQYFLPFLFLMSCSPNDLINIGGNGQKIEGNGNVTQEERSVGSFQGIDNASEADLLVIPGEEEEVKVKADKNLLSHLKTKTKNETLYIQHEPDFTNYKKLVVIVTVDDLHELEASGTGDIKIQDELKEDKLSMSLSGTGNIEGKIDAGKFRGDISGTGNLSLEGPSQDLRLKSSGTGDLSWKKAQAEKAEFDISGTGDVQIRGECGQMTITSSGTGDFEGSAFSCENVRVDLSGSGDVDVHAQKSIEVKLSGSGDVEVSGDPNEKTYRKSGSGDIE